MTIELNTGDDATVNEALRDRLAGMDDVNFMSDAEKSKLAGQEPNATADQTGQEIVAAIDAELGGSTWQSGGGGGGGGAVDSVNGETGDVVLTPDDLDDAATTNKFATAAQLAKVNALQAGSVAKTFEMIGFDCEGDPDAVRPTVAAGKPVYFFNHGNSNPTNMLNGDFAPGVPGTIKGGTKAASFTAALTDGGATYYTTDDASPVTCTLPLEATVDFPLMTSITLVQAGDAAAQFTVPAGATINGVDGGTVATSTKYKGGIAAVKIAADAWIATGDIA